MNRSTLRMHLRKIFLLSTILFVILALALACGPFGRANAQGAYDLTVYPVDTSKFTNISFKFDLFDPQGNYVSSLLEESVNLLENGQPVTITDFALQSQGMQIVVAINPGPALAVRDGFGISRYDKISQALDNWINGLPSDNTDRLSLVSTVGVLQSQGTPAEWEETFLSFAPDNRNSTASLQGLSVALGGLEQLDPPPGQKYAIIFVSPHIDSASLAVFEDITNRAIASKTRIFVWYADSDAYAEHSSAQGLKLLAERSGGTFFRFTGSETLPVLETYFTTLRNVYALSYNSRINTPGDQTLTLQITSPTDGTQTSADSIFPFDIQPPSPVLLIDRFQIVRTVPDGVYDLAELMPTEEKVEAIIEFPDGFPRDLIRTTLYVDGQIMDERTETPFNEFTWDLNAYTISADHQLSVEAVDSLGLNRQSMSVPVTVTVVQPPSGPRAFIDRYQAEITLGATIAAGVAVVLIILLGIRMRLPSIREARRRRDQYKDPVTQPVKGHVEPRGGMKAGRSPLGWIRPRQSSSPATLTRVDANGIPLTGTPIQLGSSEITFGTDPTQALHVIDDPSVSGLHARLLHDGKGVFTLYDQNSIGGTWVNMEAVKPSGQILRHGDIINFGRLSYRFSMRKPPAYPEPRIKKEK